jgi:hypothetical protein
MYGKLPHLKLLGARLLRSRRLVEHLVEEFNALPAAPMRLGCRVDLGSKIVLHVSYPSGHELTLRVHLSGCLLVSNGELTRSASSTGTASPDGPALLTQLGRLV